MHCKGVKRLEGEVVVFTGKVYVGDEWWQQALCRELAEEGGATTGKGFTASTSVVVWGDLSSQVVSDPKSLHSAKLIGARESARHVHVVDAEGFASLLDGLPARCHLAAVKKGQVPSIPKQPARLLGSHLKITVPSGNAHAGKSFAVDMDALDRGSRAHALTLRALEEHLGGRGIALHKPATGCPLFDAGWRAGSSNWIVEVKSISASTEVQQLRLGLGQLLDYRARVAQRGTKAKATLVLSEEPSDLDWIDICASVAVRLTWAPDFPDL